MMLERVVGRMFRSAMRPPRPPPNVVFTLAEENTLDKSSQSTGVVEIDNSQHVLVKIATLYAERLMNDICLVVGGVEYPSHRLILCASSEVFQVMLMNPQWSESHKSRVVLQETPACAAIFGEFIKYFYTGQIKINHTTITPVLALADKYNVKDLTKLCIDYMCSHIALAAANNQLITWYQYTLSLGHHKVALACQNFLKWNFELVANTTDFCNCNHEILSKLLQMNDLVVVNEITLYNHVVRWLEAQRILLTSECDTAESVEIYMSALVQDVMSHIRFPMMSPRQLAELLLSPLTTKYKEFFIERMAIGMSFHSDQRDRLNEICSQDENGRLLFTPRLYTSDTYSSTLCIENFSHFPSYNTRTLVFSSHTGLAEHAGDKTCEWVIDMFPKGVWFQRFYLIVWQGTIDVPEKVLRSVRLSITAKDVSEDYLKVKVGLLMVGTCDGIEHICSVIVKNHHFNCNERVLNLDDVIPFDDLNVNLLEGGDCQHSRPSSYLVGQNRDTLKVHITIVPLSDVSSLDPEIDTLIIPSR
ncbi:unnamed protein product [Nezara viridula]|uniref:BTB domain-containing protein n=1 Tax=Nezara viridula TaxID=85310 RepID=A0A9P0HSK9_NEZVI|nr:unnamed protein product [Nezara viridula]